MESANKKGPTEQETILKNLSGNERFKDNQFPLPPNETSSICQNSAKEDWLEKLDKKLASKLAVLTDDESRLDFDLSFTHPNDIETIFDNQGNTMGNFAFISAIQALAQHPEYIQRLFEYIDETNKGVFSVKFMIDGDPQTVIVDDEIVINGDEVPAFAYGKAWAIFLEKAWAKIHQTYKDSIRGEVFEVLRDLTGAPSVQYDLANGEGLSIGEIHYYLEKGNILTLQGNDGFKIPFPFKKDEKEEFVKTA